PRSDESPDCPPTRLEPQDHRYPSRTYQGKVGTEKRLGVDPARRAVGAGKALTQDTSIQELLPRGLSGGLCHAIQIPPAASQSNDDRPGADRAVAGREYARFAMEHRAVDR